MTVVFVYINRSVEVIHYFVLHIFNSSYYENINVKTEFIDISDVIFYSAEKADLNVSWPYAANKT